MYTILLRENKVLVATHSERIMQYSNLADNIRFLVPPTIGENNMTEYTTVLLEYISPVSKTIHTEFLSLSDELYNGHQQYILPVTTSITLEAGSIELQLTFYKIEIDEDGNKSRNILKTGSCRINVLPLSSWTTAVTSDTLLPLDAKISELKAIENQLLELQQQIKEMQLQQFKSDFIDDDSISDKTTYSSKQIEERFMDNSEFNSEFNELNSDYAISSDDIAELFNDD